MLICVPVPGFCGLNCNTDVCSASWRVGSGSWWICCDQRSAMSSHGQAGLNLPRGVMCCVQRPREVIYLPPGCAHCVESAVQSSLLAVHVPIDDDTDTSRTQALLKRVRMDSQNETDDEFSRPTSHLYPKGEGCQR